MSGATVRECREILESRIPNGTDSDIALFTTLPDRQGNGGIEVSAGWYAREAAQDWYTEVLGGVNVRRVNAAEIAFPNATADITIVGWGLYGNGSNTLRYWGPLRDANGNITPVALTSGDSLVWSAGDFVAHSMTPAFEFTDSVMLEKELQSIGTSDATPTARTVYTLSDEEQVRVTVLVTANGGSADKHYTRKIEASFYRDGATTSMHYEHAKEGAGTRNNLTTATADFVISGHNVQVEVTGEAATSLEWIITAEIRSDQE